MSINGEKKKSQRDTSNVIAKYELYGSRQSYFTQKMQAAMEWYFQHDYELILKDESNTKMIESRSGTHQIPVLITPENWCIADSTPLLTLLDARMPQKRFYPDGLVGALTAVLEEYFDEWSARWCIHTRWSTTEESAQHAAMSMMEGRGISGKQAKAAAQNVINWGRRAAKALGVSSDVQKRECENEIVRIFYEFEEHLKAGHKFVFGDAPTAVDCVMMGGLRAHFLHDLYPKTLFTDFHLVQKWHDEFGNAIGSNIKINKRSSDQITLANLSPYVRAILSEMSKGFKNFVLGSRTAHEAGSKAFIANVYGEDVSYLYRPYTEKSRRMLLQKLSSHLAQCTEYERKNFKEIMEHYGLEELYLPSNAIASKL